MRLIDAEALAERFVAMQECASLRDHVYLMGVLSVIDRTPTIDAVPVVHARWIEIRGEMWNELLGQKCSNCGRRVRNCGENYCPKCGAKMDGGSDEKE